MNTPEYFKFRCCMCPNIEENKKDCPAWLFKKEVTPCRFVKEYIDKEGFRYKVISEADGSIHMAMYQELGKEWIKISNIESCDSFDKIQGDLNLLAKEKELKEC